MNQASRSEMGAGTYPGGRSFLFALPPVPAETASDSRMEREDEAGSVHARDALPSQVPPPAFDFKPFSGSLLEIPDAPAPSAHASSEFFLPQAGQTETSPVASTEDAGEPAPAISVPFALEESQSEDTGSLTSNELRAKFKTAISHLDEQFRRQCELKEKPVKAKKSRLKKPKAPKRSEKRVFENSGPAPEFAEPAAVPESLAPEPETSEALRPELSVPEPTVLEPPVPEPLSSAAAQPPEIIPIAPEQTAAASALEGAEGAASPLVEFTEVLSSPEEIAEFLEEPVERFAEIHTTREPVSLLKPRDVAEPITQELPETPSTERAKDQEPEPSLSERFWRWLEGGSALDGRRHASRSEIPGLVAFYWSGGAPRPHEIVNISKTGFYLRTKELWSPGTLVRMTLQRRQSSEEGDKESIGILARVVRIDEAGVGHAFVTSASLHSLRARDVLPEHGTNEKELERFLRME